MMDKFRLMLKLGEGSYGAVWKTIDTERNETVALKSVKIPNDRVKKLIETEIDLMKDLSTPECNPFIACFYDSFQEGDTMFIEMEYIDGITLDKFSEKYRDSGEFAQLYKYLFALAQDVLKGLRDMHAKNIVHRDIKPENIMIDKNNTPKIIDLGLGCLADEVCNITENGRKTKIDCCLGSLGTPYYMSPETLLFNKSYTGSDIWSLGATLYFAATEDPPYDPYPATLRKLKSLVSNTAPPKLDTSNKELNYLVNKMLKINPSERSTAEQLLNIIKGKVNQ